MEFQTIYISSLPTPDWISKVGRTVYYLHAGTLLHRTADDHPDSIASSNTAGVPTILEPVQLTNSDSFLDLVLGAGETWELEEEQPLCEPPDKHSGDFVPSTGDQGPSSITE